MIIENESVKSEVCEVLERFKGSSEAFFDELLKLKSGDKIGMSKLRETLGLSKPAVLQSMNILCANGYAKKSWAIGCGYCGEVIFETDDMDNIKEEVKMCRACGSPNSVFIANAEVYYTIQ